MEAKRQLDVLNRRLGESKYLGGDDYSIADIATAPWYGRAIQDKGYPNAGEFLSVHEYTNIIRWMDDVSSRPAYQRGMIVNKTWGEGEPQLANRHTAADIDAALNG
jgi:GST-like protein